MPELPDDKYLRELGRAIYALNGLEWLVIEIIRRIDPAVELEHLAGMTSHKIAAELVAQVKQANLPADRATALWRLAVQYRALGKARNDLAHARPATMPDGRQRFHRWAPTRSPFVGWIDDTFLADLQQRIDELVWGLDIARDWLPHLP